MNLDLKGSAGRNTQMVVLPIFNYCAKEILSEEQLKSLEVSLDITRVNPGQKDLSDVSMLFPDDSVTSYRLFILANLNKDKYGSTSRTRLFDLASLIALHIYLIKIHMEGDLSYVKGEDGDRELWKGVDVTDEPVENLVYLREATSHTEEVVDNFMQFANNAVANLFS